MLTATRALEVAARHQRRALIEAAEYATALGEPVGFLRRHGPGGAEFEAVALESARTCAVVDARGELRRVAVERPRPEPHRRPVPAPRFSASVSRAAERALVACARPRDEQAA
jgi:hypothetical protein